MPKKKKEEVCEYHSHLFEDMDVAELKDKIVKLWKEIKSLEAEKKDYNDSIRDTIKDCKDRIDSAVFWVDKKLSEIEHKKLVEAATTAIEDGN
jgi:uncharacterized small protein (DUF1192 family)